MLQSLSFSARCAALQALRDEMDRLRGERAAWQEQQQLEQAATRHAEAAQRERLSMVERQLAHQDVEVLALREANYKLELALAGAKVQAVRGTCVHACVSRGGQCRSPQVA